MVPYRDFYALVEYSQQNGHCIYGYSKGIPWACAAKEFLRPVYTWQINSSLLGLMAPGDQILKGQRSGHSCGYWPKVHVGAGLLWAFRFNLYLGEGEGSVRESGYYPIRIVPQAVKLAVSIFLFFVLPVPPTPAKAYFLYTLRVTISHYIGKATESRELVDTQSLHPCVLGTCKTFTNLWFLGALCPLLLTASGVGPHKGCWLCSWTQYSLPTLHDLGKCESEQMGKNGKEI